MKGTRFKGYWDTRECEDLVGGMPMSVALDQIRIRAQEPWLTKVD